MENSRVTDLELLKNIFRGQTSEIQLPPDELSVAYGLFVGVFIPELKDILDVVGQKGKEYPRFNSWSTQLDLKLSIGFMKSKNDSEADRVSISDGRFINVVLLMIDGVVTIEDSNVEEKIILDTAESLTQQIPSSKRVPAGNALGWIEKISENLTRIKADLESLSIS